MSKKQKYTLFILTAIIIGGFVFYFPNKNDQGQFSHLYFAYGSNMNTAQMKERCGDDFVRIGPAMLSRYKFGFDERGYANIKYQKGEFVWGLVLEITDLCVASLDKYEGYPNVYNRKDVVVASNGQNLNVFVYIEPEKDVTGNPKQDYLNDKIIVGAKENGLPAEWIKKLEQYKK